MPCQIDIYRSAKLLIDQHGGNAAKHAALRADTLLEAGDMEGRRVWPGVLEAIEEMQWATPQRDEATH